MCTYRQFFQVEIMNTRKCSGGQKEIRGQERLCEDGHIKPCTDADGNGAVEIGGAG